MKKTIKSLLAIAITAFAFTACSDVPAPYDMPGTGGGSGGGEIAGATGTGQLTDPYNCVAAINTGGTTDWVFIKGKICEIKDEYTTQYGNGTFYISDDGTKTNKFYVYRAYYLGNKKFTSSDTQPKVGDDVIICGIITNYNGTIETTQNKGFIYELNGENRGGDPTGGGTGGEQKGTGTEADPFNVAAAVAKCKATGETATTESYYIKGIAESEYTVDSYKNVTVNILDSEGASEKFTVYRVKDKDGKGIKQGYKIEKGATLIVYGPVVNFKGNTPETATGAYLVSVNGQAPEVDDGSGSGGTTPSGDNLLTNGDFEAWTDGLPNNWKTTSSAGNATLEQSTDAHGGSYSVSVGFNATSNKRLAYKELNLKAGTYTFSFYAKATTADKSQTEAGYVPVTDGTAGKYTYGGYVSLNNTEWTLVSTTFTLDAATTVALVMMNPKNSDYCVAQNVLVDDASLVTSDGGIADDSGESGGGDTGGGNTGGDDIQTVTVAQFNAAAVSTSVWYQLTGTVKNLADGDQYGNFDLEDETGSVYVYGLLAEKGGAKKKFQELVAAKGIANGKKITIIGNRGDYNGKIEVTNAYFVSIE